MNIQPSALHDVQALSESMGLQLPSMAYIVGALVFSAIGYVAWSYGRKMQHTRVKWLGMTLMLYSYVAYETWVLYLVGIGLCMALYVWRNE